MKVLSIDHIVLTTRDIDKTIDFYTGILGMELEIFAKGRKALVFGKQKINLHEYNNEFEPKAQFPIPGSLDLCFIIDTDLDQAMKHVSSQCIAIIEGPVSRTGAQGKVTSFYFRDLDGNLLEVATYHSSDY